MNEDEMNALNRADPAGKPEAMRHRHRHWFSQSPAQWPELQEEPIPAPAWVLLVNISEDSHEYRIRAELPELKNVDTGVSAEFKDGVLAVHLAKAGKTRP